MEETPLFTSLQVLAETNLKRGTRVNCTGTVITLNHTTGYANAFVAGECAEKMDEFFSYPIFDRETNLLNVHFPRTETLYTNLTYVDYCHITRVTTFRWGIDLDLRCHPTPEGNQWRSTSGGCSPMLLSHTDVSTAPTSPLHLLLLLWILDF
ncbi:hypothetical protein AB6A40_002757 [Gnathostoma spinigerum]|uniref:Uncharacterized protein n=1 Tax=Gnathostoma spinigerum TaxID=75299 RepID=A0ABD6EGI4_9BILA